MAVSIRSRWAGPNGSTRRLGTGLVAVIVAVATGVLGATPASATPTTTTVAAVASPSGNGVRAMAALSRSSLSYTDAAGTRSSYRLFVPTVSRPLTGVVVYLDGDGMYGHDHPTSTWALGGAAGVVAAAATHGMATLSIRTPDRYGTPTFWENGRVNAAYVASLTARITRQLGTGTIWLVGYSGGSQLISQFLLPAHSAMFANGGAVITGGGGRPVAATTSMRPRAGFPLLWYTGSADDGRRSDDGYDALADAKRGSAWYQARGWNVTRQEPKGVDHDDLGTRFGAILTSALTRGTSSSAARAVATSGWQVRLRTSGAAVAASVSFPRGTKGRITLTLREPGGRARTIAATTVTRTVQLRIATGKTGRYRYAITHDRVTRAAGTVTVTG